MQGIQPRGPEGESEDGPGRKWKTPGILATGRLVCTCRRFLCILPDQVVGERPSN